MKELEIKPVKQEFSIEDEGDVQGFGCWDDCTVVYYSFWSSSLGCGYRPGRGPYKSTKL